MVTTGIKDPLGYCDVHPESRLVPAGAFLAGQYGGDEADCNPLTFWRCSRPECNNCYAPERGSFVLDRQPGGSIQANLQWQERCGRHEETPFMVIRKLGEGRRFECPLRGCDNVGPILAECVVDADEPERPQPATTTLTGDSGKEAFELSVFKEFAKAAHLPVESPENARPPRPDIRCWISGEEHWFELGRITDTELAQAIKMGWPKTPRPFSFAQREPFVRIVQQKAAKKYQTNGRPLDLVLHFDQQPPDKAALDRHIVEHTAALDLLRQGGPFSRIWIYDKWSGSVLWKSS